MSNSIEISNLIINKIISIFLINIYVGNLSNVLKTYGTIPTKHGIQDLDHFFDLNKLALTKDAFYSEQLSSIRKELATQVINSLSCSCNQLNKIISSKLSILS